MSDLIETLAPGDIVLHRDTGTCLGGIICEYTDSPYNHAEIHCDKGWAVSAEMSGVSKVSCDRKDSFVDVFRYQPIAQDRQKDLVLIARKQIEKPYDIGSLVRFPFTPRRSVRKAAQRAFICSELVVHVYHAVDLNLKTDCSAERCAPANLARSRSLVWKGAFRGGKRVPCAVRGIRHPLQDKRHWLGRLVGWLLTRISSQDDFYKEMKNVPPRRPRDKL